MMDMGALGMASASTDTDNHRLFTKLFLSAILMLALTALLFWSGFYEESMIFYSEFFTLI
ncbi:hypothetical protein AGMMS49957_00940 [Synergistales bacterium]|nr:hypothetical protein AGMMS49957_00940 [Synergistales bacterium]